MNEKHSLYTHIPHPHLSLNANRVIEQEHFQGGINTRIAIFLTKSIGSMKTAYAFIVLAIVGLLAILGILSPIVALLVAWTSQTLIQLVLLPVIMVAQNVLSRKQEVQSEETFKTTQNSFHDIEQIAEHLQAQDAKIIAIHDDLQRVLALLDRPRKKTEALR